MLFWFLYCHLQGCRYWGPSQTCKLELFLQFKGQKLKFQWIFKWVLNTPLKLWIDFTLINWFRFDWVIWEFSSSSLSTFIQLFRKLKKNQTIWFVIVSRIWKILTSFFKSLVTCKPRQNIWNKIENPVKLDSTRKVWYLVFSGLGIGKRGLGNQKFWWGNSDLFQC